MQAIAASTIFLISHFFIVGAQTSDGIQVVWLSPSAGATYGPGDTILGQWQSSSAVSSPSFRLCLSDLDSSSSTDNCGNSVYPTVKDSGKSSYYISLAVPDVSSIDSFRIEMMDEQGFSSLSSLFSISPTNPVDSDGSVTSTSSVSPLLATTPLSSPTSPTLAPLAPTSPTSTSPIPLSPDYSVTALPTSSAAISGSNSNPGLVSKNSPPTIAIALPCSAIGAIILGSILLAIYHKRKLQRQREAEASRLIASLSRKSDGVPAVSTNTSSRYPSQDPSGVVFTELRHDQRGPYQREHHDKHMNCHDPYHLDDPARYSRRHHLIPSPKSYPRTPVYDMAEQQSYRHSVSSPKPTYVPAKRIADDYRRAHGLEPDYLFSGGPSGSPRVAKRNSFRNKNAEITSAIISEYFLPSPRPPSPCFTSPAKYCSQREASIARSEPTHPRPYDYYTRDHRRHHRGRSPSTNGAQVQGLYDQVTDHISRPLTNQ